MAINYRRLNSLQLPPVKLSPKINRSWNNSKIKRIIKQKIHGLFLMVFELFRKLSIIANNCMAITYKRLNSLQFYSETIPLNQQNLRYFENIVLFLIVFELFRKND